MASASNVLEPERSKPVVEYSVSDAAIEKLRDKYTGLTATTTAEYREVVSAIAEVRDLRVRVEKTRKDLKADALEYGRKVDAEAKRITAALLSIEEPLKLTKQAVDDEKERIKKEKEDAERAKIEAELAAKRAAEEAELTRLKAERDAAERAERDRVAAEQAAESARLAEERKKLDAERAAAEAERKAIEAERIRLEREDFERKAKERAEQEARERLAREVEAKREAEARAAEEAARLLELRPDMEKLADFARQLLALEGPHVTSSEAMHALDRTLATIHEQATVLMNYCRKHGADGVSEVGDEEAE